MNKIGIIKGKGSGFELTQIFKNFVSLIVKEIYNEKIEFIETNNIYETYWSIREHKLNDIPKIISKEVIELQNEINSLIENEVNYCFRTGINAETLYLLRQRFNVKKEILINYKKNKILIIRDETQGFYANNYSTYSEKKIEYCGEYTEKKISGLIDFSIEKGHKYLSNDFKIFSIFKYHLFGNVLEKWFNKYRNKEIKLYQPDTGIFKIFNYFEDSNNNDLLLIVSNEVGDIIYEFLIKFFNLGNKNELFTKNIYFSNNKQLEVFQTVHGSADNIANQDIINPISTIRVATKIISELFQDNKLLLSLESAISSLKNDNIKTRDQGGSYNTRKYIEHLTSKFFINYGK